jgi:hypothetical protein
MVSNRGVHSSLSFYSPRADVAASPIYKYSRVLTLNCKHDAPVAYTGVEIKHHIYVLLYLSGKSSVTDWTYMAGYKTRVTTVQ